MHLLYDDRSKPSPSKKAKREQSPSPPVTKEAPLTRAKVPAYALSDADRKEEGDMDVSLESVHTDSSPALPSRRSTPDVDPINLDRTESSPEAPESSKTASHRLAEIVKAEADELDLDSLNPPKQEEDEEESRYSITTKSSTPAKSKSIVPSLLPVKHEDDQDSEDESQVAHSLGAATSGSRSTSKRSREQSEEKPSIEKRPNANNKRAARQAYWAAKGVKQEDDENEL